MTFEFTISHGMCLPMLAEYGTHEQKAAYLADNISGEKVCADVLRARRWLRRRQPRPRPSVTATPG